MEWRNPRIKTNIEPSYESFCDVVSVLETYHNRLRCGKIDSHCLYVSLKHLKKLTGPYKASTIVIVLWLAIINVGTLSPPFTMISDLFPRDQCGKKLKEILFKLDYHIDRCTDHEQVSLAQIEEMWNE
jgi:hypothetical protein